MSNKLQSKFTKLTLLFTFALLSNISAMSQVSGLPMLDINKYVFNFGKTKYLELKCDTIIFRNIGDTVLSIYQIDSILRPFFSDISFPHTLEKGDSLKFYICYKPFRASQDSQRVFLRADTRLSHSIALLFDISMSMDEYLLSERKTRLQAANEAGENFINSMLNTPKVSDEAAVYSFAYSFYVNQNWTTDKQSLIDALPVNTLPSTAFFDACGEAINRLKTRKYQKVLVALTDGEDNRSRNYDASDVIAQAKANNIKVYTVGVGSNVSDNILNNIAVSTGGLFFKAQTSAELKDIYFKIFNLLSKNVTLYFDILGSCSEPLLQLECSSEEDIYPDDTLTYKVHLNSINTEYAMNSNYTLKFRFNPKLLLPLTSSSYPYEYNGIFELNGINKVNLDSLPLATVQFLTLLGDSACTDLELVSLTWDDNWYPPILPNVKCNTCISSCVRSLSNVLFYEPLLLSISPNPVNNNAHITLRANYNGQYTLKLYDMLGSLVLINDYGCLNVGLHYFDIDLSEIPAGTYYYLLSSPMEIITKPLRIIK